jgi:hypothetical protein
MNPTVNLNGTSGEELLNQVSAVLAGLRQTQQAMSEATPHGRDYQHDASGESYRAARAEHINRMTQIFELIRWYEESQRNIYDQVTERAEARKARMAR